MQFSLDGDAKEYLEKIFEVQEQNLDLLDLIQKYLDGMYDFSPLLKDLDIDNVRYFNNYYSGLIVGTFLIEDNDAIIDNMCSILKRLDISEYSNNSYHKILENIKIKENGWDINKKSYEPLQCFIYDNLKVDEDNYYKINPSFGYFIDKYQYPYISYKNREWMSLNPNEINTMKTAIKVFKGRCLVLGLGLGYFTYELSEKDDVSEITVVELDKAEIELFKKRILPNIPNKHKITIINQDAFKFIESCDDYDYCFVDIWHDVGDGLPLYKRFRNLLDNKDMISYYWIEESIISYFRMLVISTIKYEYENKEIQDDLYLDIRFKLRKKVVSSISDIKELLNFDNLRLLII